MTNPSEGYVTPIATDDKPLVRDEVAHVITEFNQHGKVNVFNRFVETGLSSRFECFDLSGQREGEIGAFDPKYTLSNVPELCELCRAAGKRNLAVNICTTCKKQICKACKDTHEHLEVRKPCHREICMTVGDETDGKYTIGKVPDLCELCIAVEKRNVAVKLCMTCKKKICKSCKYVHKHLKESEPCDSGFCATLDADGSKYTTCKISDICDLCIAVGERKVAVKHCISCKKHICTSCVNAHKRFQALMSHEIVDVESFESNYHLKSTKCKEREKKHIGSALTTNISAVESGSQMAMAFVKQQYQRIETYMEKVQARNVESLSDFRRIIENLKRLLEDRKQNIENTIEVIQIKLIDKSKLLISNTEKETEVSIRKIDEVKFLCRARVEKIDEILEAGHTEEIVAMHNFVIEEYRQATGDIDQKDIKEEIFHCRLQLLSELHKLHKDLEAKVDEGIRIVRQKVCIPKCGNIVNVLHNREVVQTGVHKIQLVSDCTSKYSGIATMSGGKHLILSDCCNASSSCGNVCLYNLSNRTHIKQKMNRPFGIAVLRLDQSQIAVTSPVDKEILIISTMEKGFTTVKTFETEKVPVSLVSLDSGCIGATFHQPISFDFIDVSENHIKTLKSYTQDSTGRTFKSFRFVAIDEFRSHVIQPCHKENAVYSFDYSGDPVFEYRDSKLRSPQGVSLDQDGNIYICSFLNHMLHVLAPTGIKVKYVTTGVPCFPRAICFDETGQKFWTNGKSFDDFEILCTFSLQEKTV